MLPRSSAVLLWLILSTASPAAEPIRYAVRFPAPHTHYVEVEAKFVNAVVADTTQSTPFPESGYFPQVSAAETALGRDSYALIPAMAWAIALAAAAVLGSLLAARWQRWPAWIVTVPVLLAILWNLYESLSALLPNVY